MHADLTRRTFDPALGFRSVVMQQGRVLLDAEWNEQTEITAHHDEVRTADVVGAAGGVDPGDGSPGPFAVVSLATGLPPDAGPVAWADLAVTRGRYYVDGVLAESSPADGAPWPLADQPFLRAVGADPGLVEPTTDGRYAVLLDVFDHLVTPDERPELLESALGGPDTAVRDQTAWQVRLAALPGDEVCSEVDAALPVRVPRTMTADLEDAVAQTDPCAITAGGGYELLESQLFRVEVFDVDPQPRFVWSRENGSVVAGLVEVEPSTVAGADDALTLDRVGRDEGLSILPGDLVEVTSTDRVLRHLPGYLARVGSTADSVVDTVVHVAWVDTALPDVAGLGRAPVVRRWDGGPTPLATTPSALEGGISVAFPAGGTPAVGDHWLIPARSVQLAYGTTARQGTIEWPGAPGAPVALPPRGPREHRARLGVLERSPDGWTLVADCRDLFPPLTALTAIDLVGGDGQEAMPGDELPEPVRVAVRKGGIPVAGAAVRFTAAGGTLRTAAGALGNPGVVTTGADGVAAVLWTLDPDGDTTQRLTAQRLTDVLAPQDVDVVATGRLSVARQVAWQPVCDGFGRTRTVQDALAQLVRTPSLKLLGGDGQEVDARGRTVPRVVRVAVDDPCGPARGAVVTAVASKGGGLVLAVKAGAPVPPTLVGVPRADEQVSTKTDEAGVATFVWQPSFLDPETGALLRSDVLTLTLDEAPGPVAPDEAPIQVTASLDPGGSRTPGVHVTAVRFFSGEDLENDATYGFDQLGGRFPGIAVVLDAPVRQDSVQRKPVGRVLLELPWPTPPEDDLWGSPSWARRTVEIAGELNADGALIVWSPVQPIDETLKRVTGRLRALAREQRLGEPPLPLLLRLQLDGWAIVGEDESLHLNGHTETVVVDGFTRLRLPTTDEVTGGRFETWFWFSDGGPERPGPQVFAPGRLALSRLSVDVGRLLRPPGTRATPGGPTLDVDDLSGRTRALVERRAAEARVEVTFVEEDAPGVRRNVVLGTDAPAGTALGPGDRLVVRVARGAGG